MTVATNLGFTSSDVWVLGSTRRYAITITDGSGSVKDLNGATFATFRVKDLPPGSPNAATKFEKTLGSGVIVTDANGGIITVTIDAADSGALVAGDYYYEVRITDAAGDTDTVKTGQIRLSPTLF